MIMIMRLKMMITMEILLQILQFANEHPAIFNDLFTPTEPVDPELLDPSKGFTPKMIKYGLGIPGVAKCKVCWN